MRAILLFHNYCEGQRHKTVSTDHNNIKRGISVLSGYLQCERFWSSVSEKFNKNNKIKKGAEDYIEICVQTVSVKASNGTIKLINFFSSQKKSVEFVQVCVRTGTTVIKGSNFKGNQWKF